MPLWAGMGYGRLLPDGRRIPAVSIFSLARWPVRQKRFQGPWRRCVEREPDFAATALGHQDRRGNRRAVEIHECPGCVLPEPRQVFQRPWPATSDLRDRHVMPTARHPRGHAPNGFFDGAEYHVHEEDLEALLQGGADDGSLLLGAEDGFDDERPIGAFHQISHPAFAFIGGPDVRLFQGKFWL